MSNDLIWKSKFRNGNLLNLEWSEFKKFSLERKTLCSISLQCLLGPRISSGKQHSKRLLNGFPKERAKIKSSVSWKCTQKNLSKIHELFSSRALAGSSRERSLCLSFDVRDLCSDSLDLEQIETLNIGRFNAADTLICFTSRWDTGKQAN